MIVTPPGMLETLRVGGHSLMMIVTPAGQLEISEYMSALTIDSIDDGLCLFTKDSVRRRPAQVVRALYGIYGVVITHGYSEAASPAFFHSVQYPIGPRRYPLLP